MHWEKCKNEFIHKILKNKDRAKSLLSMAELRFEFWSTIKLNRDKYCPIIIDGYYEIIKELLTALLISKGFKSDNHECLISFFKNFYTRYDYEIHIIHQLKNIRNDIDYKGRFIKYEYLKRNELEFKHIIKILKELINEESK